MKMISPFMDQVSEATCRGWPYIWSRDLAVAFTVDGRTILSSKKLAFPVRNLMLFKRSLISTGLV